MQRRGKARPRAAAGGGGGGGGEPGVSAAEMYPAVYEALPSMSARTFDAITRHGMVVNSRRMGYADARPDVRPGAVMMPAAAKLYAASGTHHVYHEPRAALDYVPPHSGAQGRAEGAWAAQLRPHLHASGDDPRAARTGAGLRRMWAAGGLAPSEAATGYGYRHASAHSMLTGSGSVYDRLTDVRGYTGTHRHRFDSDGRGLGLAGRENSLDYGLERAREAGWADGRKGGRAGGRQGCHPALQGAHNRTRRGARARNPPRLTLLAHPKIPTLARVQVSRRLDAHRRAGGAASRRSRRHAATQHRHGPRVTRQGTRLHSLCLILLLASGSVLKEEEKVKVSLAVVMVSLWQLLG